MAEVLASQAFTEYLILDFRGFYLSSRHSGCCFEGMEIRKRQGLFSLVIAETSSHGTQSQDPRHI